MKKVTNEMSSEISPKKSRRWTPEMRERQARRIRKQKIWEKTGPKTPSGTDAAKMNAAKHGLRSESYRTVCALFREQQSILNATIAAVFLELEQQQIPPPPSPPPATQEGE